MSALRQRAHHIVRFTNHDDDLVPAVADFVADGVRLGERVALVITRDHWTAVESLLVERHVRIGTALKHHQVLVTDVEDALAQIVVGGRPDPTRFQPMAAAILEALEPPVRVFGELAPRIAALDIDAAIEFEALGEHLAAQAGVNILCAYHLDGLKEAEHVDRVCKSHDAAVAGGGQPAHLAPIVLLADDFHDGRELYEEYLRLKGYQVVAAHDGIQAISLAHIARPAVMLLDVRMPGMSGLEAMQILKKDADFRHTPIVALTAHALDAEREMFLASGFDEVLAKPVLPAVVAQTVERLLN